MASTAFTREDTKCCFFTRSNMKQLKAASSKGYIDILGVDMTAMMNGDA
jgi:hypothetical protein